MTTSGRRLGPSRARLALLVVTTVLGLCVTGAVTAVHTAAADGPSSGAPKAGNHEPTSRQKATPRKRVRPKPKPRPAPTQAPTPTPAPTVPSSPQGCRAGSVERLGVEHCIGWVFGLNRPGYYSDGTALALLGVAVEEVTGPEVVVTGGPSCAPGDWCGQTLPSAAVVWGDGAPPVAAGDVAQLYGVVTGGRLVVSSAVVVGSCVELGYC